MAAAGTAADVADFARMLLGVFDQILERVAPRRVGALDHDDRHPLGAYDADEIVKADADLRFDIDGEKIDRRIGQRIDVVDVALA